MRLLSHGLRGGYQPGEDRMGRMRKENESANANQRYIGHGYAQRTRIFYKQEEDRMGRMGRIIEQQTFSMEDTEKIFIKKLLAIVPPLWEYTRAKQPQVGL